MTKNILKELSNALVNLNREETENRLKEAIDAGFPASKIVLNGLTPALQEVGERFENDIYFLSDLMFAAFIMDSCMKKINPMLESEGDKTPTMGKIVIGTVKGDLHDIGKNIMISLLTGSNFQVYDLGIDVPSEKFVQKVKEIEADVLGMSALLVPTSKYFQVVIDALKKVQLRDKIFVIIGGSIVTEELAKECGADACCTNAIQGLKLIREIVQCKKKTP